MSDMLCNKIGWKREVVGTAYESHIIEGKTGAVSALPFFFKNEPHIFLEEGCENTAS